MRDERTYDLATALEAVAEELPACRHSFLPDAIRLILTILSSLVIGALCALEAALVQLSLPWVAGAVVLGIAGGWAWGRIATSTEKMSKAEAIAEIAVPGRAS